MAGYISIVDYIRSLPESELAKRRATMPFGPLAAPTCETCAHFTKGECHRYPPMVVADNGVGGETNNFATVWPAVGENDTCGEHHRGLVSAAPRRLLPKGAIPE